MACFLSLLLLHSCMLSLHVQVVRLLGQGLCLLLASVAMLSPLLGCS
jgi:hypothetical protein